MSEHLPVSYAFVYRSEMNEICAINLYCIDREAAYDRARYDVENNRLFEEIYIEDKRGKITIKFDIIGEVSGTFDITDKKEEETYNYHFEDFFDIPLGQFDRYNRKVYWDCYDEIKVLWDSDPTIKNAFIIEAKSDYDNIANFIQSHCDFSEKQREILMKYYGAFFIPDSLLMAFCRGNFGGYYKWEFTRNDTTKSDSDTTKKGECRPMNYLFSKSLTEPYRWVEHEFSDRSEVIEFVEEHLNELKPFAVYESGHIYGYAVEMSEEDKPQAILYPHKATQQLIWIDMG